MAGPARLVIRHGVHAVLKLNELPVLARRCAAAPSALPRPTSTATRDRGPHRAVPLLPAEPRVFDRAKTWARSAGPRRTSPTTCRAPTRRGQQEEHLRALRPRQRLLRRVARPLDDLFVGDLHLRATSRSRRRSAPSTAASPTGGRQGGQIGARDRLRLGRLRRNRRRGLRRQVYGITLSPEQLAYAERLAAAGPRQPRDPPFRGLSRHHAASSTTSPRSR